MSPLKCTLFWLVQKIFEIKDCVDFELIWDAVTCFRIVYFLQINPDTLELVEEEVASCDEILSQEVSNIKEKSSVKEMPSLNLSANSTPEKNPNSNKHLQIKTPPEQVETTPNLPIYPMAMQQGGPIFSQKQRPLKKRILNEQKGQNFLGNF